MNCHEKHRQRLRTQFLRGGLESFAQHNVLEMLLFYSIPRKNTNELAHDLIRRFGSIANVFDAPYEALIQVPGVGEQTATLLKFVPALCKQYLLSRNEDRKYITSREEAVDFLSCYFANITKENAVVVSLDAAGGVIRVMDMPVGTVESSSIDLSSVYFELLSTSPAGVVIAHGHPRGLAAPSSLDIKTTEMIADLLAGFNTRLCDHIIFARNDVFCMSKMTANIRPGIFAFSQENENALFRKKG